jgi:GNAT superfamily N-acetyltransferase
MPSPRCARCWERVEPSLNTTLQSASAVRVRELAAGESLKPFIDLSWQINARDPRWVPPLRMTLETVLDRGKHPFHRHAEVAYFLAERGGRPVGRVAAIVNHLHNQFHHDQAGFFGLFECEERADTAAALLDEAAGWLRERGMRCMRGPMNLSTNEEAASPGVLVEGFDTPPMVQMSHTPPFYRTLMEGAGMQKSKDLLAFWFDDPNPPERIVRGFERALQRGDTTIRPLNLKEFQRDVDIIKQIYNSAWSQNWGFVPMTDAEFDHMAREFRPVVDPDLCLIAEVRGEPVGFSLALPDLNQAFRHLRDGRLFPFGLFRFLWHKRKITGLRVITLGFKPAYQHLGLGAALYLRAWQIAVSKGYDHAEASWILEDNVDMVRPLERMGGRLYKRYRIYERPL